MTALLEVSNLARAYDVRRGRWPFAKPATLHAVDGVALTRRVKQGFDPGRVLNPGRMYEGV